MTAAQNPAAREQTAAVKLLAARLETNMAGIRRMRSDESRHYDSTYRLRQQIEVLVKENSEINAALAVLAAGEQP